MFTMKAFSLSLFILAMFIFCSAFPQEDRDNSSSLIGSATSKGQVTPLRRKPPPKVPGPQLAADDDGDSEGNYNTRGRGGRGRKGAGLNYRNHDLEYAVGESTRNRHLANGGRYNGIRREETQEERSRAL